jgi:hypothetical protein
MTISIPKRIVRPASSTPQSVAEKIRHHLHEIADLFDEPKLTLVVRTVSLEGDLIVGNDDAHEAITAIKKMCEQHSPQAEMPLN